MAFIRIRQYNDILKLKYFTDDKSANPSGIMRISIYLLEKFRVMPFRTIFNFVPIRGHSRGAVRGGYLYFETIFQPHSVLQHKNTSSKRKFEPPGQSGFLVYRIDRITLIGRDHIVSPIPLKIKSDNVHDYSGLILLSSKKR